MKNFTCRITLFVINVEEFILQDDELHFAQAVYQCTLTWRKTNHFKPPTRNGPLLVKADVFGAIFLTIRCVRVRASESK